MAEPIFRPGHPVAGVRQVIAIGGQDDKDKDKDKDMCCQNGPYNLLRCGGENMAARVMAYCLACMEAVAREEEER